MGISLIIAGSSAASSAEGLDPEADFEEIGRCRIIGVEHWTDFEAPEDSGEATCTDVYRYEFLSLEESSVHTSREERVVRFERRASEVSGCSGSPKPGRFSEGEAVACWRPRALPVREEYRCGSEECVKIFDPQEDADEARAVAGAIAAAGWGCFVIAVVMCCTCVAGLACLSAYQSRQEDMRGHGGGAPTVVQPHQPYGAAGAPTVVQGTVVGAPQPQLMEIVLPPGTVPGQPVMVQAPDGRQVSVMAPWNAAPGQHIQIQV